MRLRSIVLILCALLSVMGITQAFRSDEIWSLQTVAVPFGTMLQRLRADIHPPLFYLLLQPWTALAGTSEFASRMLSVLLHWTAAAVVFETARRRSGPETAAVCAAVFLASPLGLVAAQLVRMYTLLELTAALSVWCWLRFVESDRPDRRWWAGFVLANIAGTFTHVWFFFLLASIAVAHLAVWRRRRLPAMAIAACASLLPYSILWLPVMLGQAGRAADNLAWLRPPSWTDPLEIALMQVGACLVLAVIGVLRRKANDAKSTPVMWLLWISVLAIPFAISFRQPVFWPRFTVVGLPALSVALGSFISERLRPPTALWAVSTVSIVFTLSLYMARTPECDAKWTAQWLEKHTHAGDLVLFTNLSRLPVEHYLNVASERSSFPATIDAHPGYEGRIDPTELETEVRALVSRLADAAGPRRVVLLQGSNPEMHGRLVRALDAKFPREQDLCHKCTTVQNYYREITVWRTR